MYSPDITKRSTPGGRVASAQRSLRLTELRRLGISVVNWDPEEPLAMALDRTQTTSPALSQQ
jgi:hypothetical protein